MQIDEVRRLKDQLYTIAAKYRVKKIFIFGSVARGKSSEASDIDFLIEMESDSTAFGVGGFQFEAEKLLGTEIDVIPTFVLPGLDDQNFVQTIQAEAIAL